KVWLNGEFLGENVNGFLPFEFDVTDKLKPGAVNQLVVRVDNTAKVKWLPGAKKIEWMLYGGILESVTLETRSTVFISDLTVRAIPNGPGATVDCEVEITSFASAAKNISVRAHIADVAQPPVAAKLRIAPGAKVMQGFSISLPKADLWSPEKPRLYTLTATIDSNGPLDTLTSPIGIRKIETRGRDILVNGRRFLAKGVNRY